MTRPLNDDGTFPLRRRLQLVLRIVEGNKAVREVVREVKPTWMVPDPSELKAVPLKEGETLNRFLVQAVLPVTQLVLPGMVDELFKE